MTNLRGALLYINGNGTTQDVYIEQDISSLGIIAPWRVDIRFRLQWDIVDNFDQWTANIVVGFGGDADDNYQRGVIEKDLDALEGIKCDNNRSNADFTNAAQEATFSGISFKTFMWVELECLENGNLIMKKAEDTSTDIPASWDLTENQSGTVFTAESTIQSLKIGMQAGISSGSLVMMEIDEIHVIQD